MRQNEFHCLGPRFDGDGVAKFCNRGCEGQVAIIGSGDSLIGVHEDRGVFRVERSVLEVSLEFL